MLQVTNLIVRSLNLDHLDVFWEIAAVPGPRADGDMHEIFNYEFYVLRAGDSPLGPYEAVGGPFLDTYQFRDVRVSLLHKWREYFYKLKVVDRRSGEIFESEPVSHRAPPPDLIAAEIIRNEDLLLREFVGRRCWLFSKRTFGPRCTCFDVTLNRMMRSGHLPCFGTGYLGGYMSPVEVFLQIDPSPKQTQHSPFQEVQPGDTTARMISYPPVSPQDILVETENRRWRVMAVSGTQRLRATVRQELTIHEIPRGDVEYNLPIKVDLEKHRPASARNFKNSQNIDPREVSDLLACYGLRPAR
jgi:hypothetical protein